MPSSKLSIGIVGLPNVGKSTLFKTLTKKQVLIANYPFATIDPNIGVVLVPDERVDKLWELSRQEARLAPNGAAKSKKKIYATVDFVDIAGLVKGASQGEGLGNKFLSHIREVDAVLYVLRAFKNPDIINTQNEINPLKEKEILDVELILKDLETVNRVLEKPAKSRGHLGGPAAISPKASLGGEMEVCKKAKDFLSAGKVLVNQEFADDEKEILNSFQLLTFKPRLYLLNGKPEEITDVGHLQNTLIIDVATEFEAEGLSKDERQALGLPELSETDILIKKSYELLNLITFLTTGEDETRAWTINKGEKAPKAGAVIHTDFENKFVKAEVVFWKDLLDAGSYAKAREQGKLRTEGKEYVVKDGDVIEFKHG
ncbi:MAG: redox-regulated ATPase YchF [Patescibacteria group bacterium]